MKSYCEMLRLFSFSGKIIGKKFQIRADDILELFSEDSLDELYLLLENYHLSDIPDIANYLLINHLLSDLQSDIGNNRDTA